ncbi:MAG: ATP-binding protein, partial [Verrucomicrobia bacterium]|nr:ATP-binding protein [Verrucomicrobiota bacterium]
ANLPPLFADEGKVKQIMYNLLSNAIKFTPDGGRVTVTAAVRNHVNGHAVPGLKPSLSGECLEVVVVDTGIGVHPRDHQRIFAEFEQVDSSCGRHQQGTGLGLALTKRLIELHGGRIEVESDGVEGRGSRFKFVLPLSKLEPKPAKTEGKTARHDEAQRPLVLLAGAEEPGLRLVGNYLEGVGYRISVVPEIDKLAETLKNNRPYALVIHNQTTRQYKEHELLALRVQLPDSIPAVICSIDTNGKPEFSLLAGDGAATAPKKSRLTDVLRHNTNTAGKEVRTALIIDDEPALLEMLAKTLLLKGFQVLLAPTGRRGIEFATGAHPDVIILDLAMPDCSGFQVVEQLRAQPETKNTPIFIHTGTVLNEQERQHLAGQVQSITFKATPQSLLADLDRLEAPPVGDLRP